MLTAAVARQSLTPDEQATLEGVLDGKSLSEEWVTNLRVEWQRQLFEVLPYFIFRSFLHVIQCGSESSSGCLMQIMEMYDALFLHKSLHTS